MTDWRPCCSFPLLPLQWLSSSPASTVAALLALHVLAGISRAPMGGCHWKAFQGKGEEGKMRFGGAPLTTHSPSCLKNVFTTTHHCAPPK
eukprot:1138770-Pelagomonas_calceolata.AAC.4